ncbi:MAG: LysR family transcriptional regulator, partial [Actinobacteria bacterium]|nr:LysR family transcriptional regulator [Actinomycetota bacterium]
ADLCSSSLRYVPSSPAMDLRQLAALVAVADAGTFSAAAARLHTVQSNVSTHVARLERELGVALVDRSAGQLTAEGDVAVARARRVQAEVDALVADVASLHDEVAGHVRMGVIGTTGRWMLPPLLAAVGARYPKVRIAILEGNTTSLLPQLLAGALDLTVVNLPVSDPQITVDDLFEEDLVLVAPAGHHLASRQEVTLEEVAAHELLLPPPGTSIRVELDRAAEGAGVTLQAQIELDGLRLIASLAFEGFGAAILPATAVPALPNSAWQRIRLAGVTGRRVGLARRRRGLPSAPIRALQEAMIEVVTDQAPSQPGVHPSPRSSE